VDPSGISRTVSRCLASEVACFWVVQDLFLLIVTNYIRFFEEISRPALWPLKL
jgi:hypothetical protein